MWGFGGRYYWGRKERGKKAEGVVVVFAWMSSQDKHLKNYIDLYASLGWNSLISTPNSSICKLNTLPHPTPIPPPLPVVIHSWGFHPATETVDAMRDYYNNQINRKCQKFFPDKAASLALDFVNELVQIKLRLSPIVFACFSGGPKACMYKVLQIIEGKCEEQHDLSMGAPYLILTSEEAVQVKGLRDDTTCIVVDIQLPAEKPDPQKPPPKKQGKGVFKSMFRKKHSESSSQADKEEYCEPAFVEELFEEGSAMLSERSEFAPGPA
ncbi:hypothetical protein OROHE_000527 [Orobanche hederae]